jgi:hypothetical protein
VQQTRVAYSLLHYYIVYSSSLVVKNKRSRAGCGAHFCILSYLGGRDLKDSGSKPAQAKS